MNRRALAEAKRAWQAAVAAREEAEETFARAEAKAERACGDDQWDAQCDVHTAHAQLEAAQDRERTAKAEYRRVAPDRPRPFMTRTR